jgi:hypothetical protein
VKGDRVLVVVDVGGGAVREFEVSATKAGRRVEVSVARGSVEVTEVTRSGQPVRSARFMAARVVALVEHPAPEVAGPTAHHGSPSRPPSEPLPLGLDEPGRRGP